MSKALEYFISSPHWLDALTPPLERHLEYLTRTIALLLSRAGPDAQPASAPPPTGGGEEPPRPSPGVAAGFSTPEAARSLAVPPATTPLAASSGPVESRRRIVVTLAAIACVVIAAGYYVLAPKARLASSSGVIDQPSTPPGDVSDPGVPPSHPAPRHPAANLPARAAVPETRSLRAAPNVSPHASTTSPATPPSGAVDHELVGTWAFTNDDRAGHTVSDFTVDANGAYHREYA